MKPIDYQRIKNIDFTSAYGKKGKFDEMIEELVALLGIRMILHCLLIHQCLLLKRSYQDIAFHNQLMKKRASF